jgi:hypothetical protein
MLLLELKRLHSCSTVSPSATLLIGNFLKFDQALHEFIQDERERKCTSTSYSTRSSIFVLLRGTLVPTPTYQHGLARPIMWACFREVG